MDARAGCPLLRSVKFPLDCFDSARLDTEKVESLYYSVVRFIAPGSGRQGQQSELSGTSDGISAEQMQTFTPMQITSPLKRPLGLCAHEGISCLGLVPSGDHNCCWEPKFLPRAAEAKKHNTNPILSHIVLDFNTKDPRPFLQQVPP